MNSGPKILRSYFLHWDRCPNELTKTMTDEEFQIMKMWVNTFLIEDTSQQ